MGFRDRLSQERDAAAATAHTEAETAARARDTRLAAAIRAAEAVVTEVYEAADALREDQTRSEQQLMSFRDPDSRYSGNIGTILTTVREETPPNHWWQRPTVRQRPAFAGWWVRYRSSMNAPYELEIALVGEPKVGLYSSDGSSGMKWGLEDFAAGGVYDYQYGEYHKVKEIRADEVLRDALGVIKEHLLYLAQSSGGQQN
jgi:hypothetical protein